MAITLLEGTDLERVTNETYTYYYTLTSGINDSVTTIPLNYLVDNSLPAAGTNATITIDPGGSNEEVIDSWTGVNTTQVTGVTRSATPSSHVAGELVKVVETSISNTIFINGVKDVVNIYAYSAAGNTLTFFVKPKVQSDEPNPVWYTLYNSSGTALSVTIAASAEDMISVPINSSDHEIKIVAASANAVSMLIRGNHPYAL